MNKRIEAVLMAVLLVSSLIAGGCSSAPKQESVTPSVEAEIQTKAHMDYRYYESVAEAARDADTIVMGTVKATLPSYRKKYDDKLTLVKTDSEIQVTKVFKGVVKPGETLVVVQNGGVLNGKTYHYRSTQLFQANERLILFLKKLNDGKYVALTPVQGELRISSENTVKFGRAPESIESFVSQITKSVGLQ